MHKITQGLFLTASVILILVFFLPIWNIDLEAPQYPEGLGLNIWINTIDGVNKHDLKNINQLNHYIGMKVIEPDSIAELKIMPFLFGFLIVFGLAGAFLKKKYLLLIWILLFFILAVAGMIDFYLWEYDYGHNLDPAAAIKIPGMSYQPPLFGTKQLLNMRTTSLPASGGWIAFISLFLGVLAFIYESKVSKNQELSPA